MNKVYLTKLGIIKGIIGALVFIYLLLLLKSAWLSDDAYITFRTIDNFVNGYGLRWNIAERVQSYTHPLWMFLLSAIYFFTREIFFTSLVISIIISVLTVYLIVFKLTHSYQNTLIILFAIIFSKAFIDYSTSGLENPLTNFLLVLYGLVYFKKETGKEKIFWLSLLTSLIMVNRMDCILLVLPPLIAEIINTKQYRSVLIAFAGLIPFLLWELFSLFYYGFPFPNTAYAKLNTGIERIELIEQGLKYFYASFRLDPLTLPLIFAVIFLSAQNRYLKYIPFTAGIILYFLYVTWVGGDFMNGRFFAAPFVASLIVLAKITIRSVRILPIALVFIFVLGFSGPFPTVLGDNGKRDGRVIDKNGICDERAFYTSYTSLIDALRRSNLPQHPWIYMGIYVRTINSKYERSANIGFFGFYAGRYCHILDEFGLSDPLLSKLPSKTDWRIGHFQRAVPLGYEESLITSENKIDDKHLAEYYNKLVLITRGDLFDPNRLKTIWKMNTNQYDYMLTNYLSSFSTQF